MAEERHRALSGLIEFLAYPLVRPLLDRGVPVPHALLVPDAALIGLADREAEAGRVDDLRQSALDLLLAPAGLLGPLEHVDHRDGDRARLRFRERSALAVRLPAVVFGHLVGVEDRLDPHDHRSVRRPCRRHLAQPAVLGHSRYCCGPDGPLDHRVPQLREASLDGLVRPCALAAVASAALSHRVDPAGPCLVGDLLEQLVDLLGGAIRRFRRLDQQCGSCRLYPERLLEYAIGAAADVGRGRGLEALEASSGGDCGLSAGLLDLGLQDPSSRAEAPPGVDADRHCERGDGAHHRCRAHAPAYAPLVLGVLLCPRGAGLLGRLVFVE